MPNHVTTICTITGPAADVAAFAEAHVRPDETDSTSRPRLNFRTVIPMPESVAGTTSGTEQEVAMFALTGAQKPDKYGFRALFKNDTPLSFPYVQAWGCRTREELLVYLEKNNPKALEQGRASLKAFEESGFYDWYDWSIARWGTKWGAYDFEDRERGDGRYVFKFETAWSFPEPVFRALASKWPTLTFAVVSYDEGGNFACVGEFNGAGDFRRVDCTPELYERVYGRKPDAEEDEET